MFKLIEREKENSLFLKFQSELRSIDVVVPKIEKFFVERCQEVETFNLNLVARELLNNAVIHGNKNKITKYVTCRALIKNMIFRLCIKDEGLGFNWRERISYEPKADNEGGRGMLILKSFGFRYHFNEKGNIVTVEVNLQNN
jgi:serine/threonine-protein kinase RsbW